MVTDYSQTGEQTLIAEAVQGLPVGRVLDIGAGDGVTFSNSRQLILDGWGATLVEPAAWAFDRLVSLYADYDPEPPAHVILVNALLGPGDYRGLRQWHYSRDDHLSTAVDAEARKWPSVPFVLALLAETPLDEVLDSYVGVGLTSVVSIDAEGMTFELVRAYMQHRAWDDVQVLCYEHEYEEHLILPKPFELVAETPNNVIARRR